MVNNCCSCYCRHLAGVNKLLFACWYKSIWTPLTGKHQNSIFLNYHIFFGFHLTDKPEFAFLWGAKGLLKPVGVSGRWVGKCCQPCSQPSPSKRLVSPSELQPPTTDAVLFYEYFLVDLPGFFWSLLKSFTATLLWKEQLVKSEDRGSCSGANKARWLKAESGAVAPVRVKARPDLQNLVKTSCQILRWCQLRWLHCCGGLVPACSSWCHQGLLVEV